MPEHKGVAAVGGGVAGCAAARELTAAGKEVALFEAADGLGGRPPAMGRS
ncbi:MULTISPECIES: FAD-dependent oxidoreductase [unclassified Nocardiopsis]